MHNKIGVLLINLGTPAAPTAKAVSHYLREFLSDPKVIDLPTPFRQLLVCGLIVPLRAKKSAHAYQQIWTEQGSPLFANSLALMHSLQALLGTNTAVALGMNYGEPSIANAVDELTNSHCDKIIVLPLFPQYSSAVTESILIKLSKVIKQKKITTPISIIKDFFNQADFINGFARNIQTVLNTATPEYLLLSYHGLPMRQLNKTSHNFCKQCDPLNACPAISPENRNCYRAQCYQTSQALTTQLSLGDTRVLTTFQSRLGRLTWAQPYTETTLSELAALGVKRLAVACPSFVIDCLETLEEIGIRGRKTWTELGGTEFTLIPGLNAQASWVQSLLATQDAI